MGNPPLWVLKNTIIPGGIRLFKNKPAWVDPPKTGYRHYPQTKQFDFARDSGNLVNNQYRFWIGSEHANSPFRKCRACNTALFTEEGAKAHQKIFGCTKLLTAAFAALKKDKKCVICDDLTPREMWGVPLCKGLCENKWKFDILSPLSLRAALELVRMQQKSNCGVSCS